MNTIIRSILTLFNSIHCKHCYQCFNYSHRMKFEVFASVRNSHRASQLAAKNIPFFQNDNLTFLMNTIIRSILTLFTSYQHRHRHYRGIIQIFELRIFNFLKALRDLQ